jgi:hypothetical protein
VKLRASSASICMNAHPAFLVHLFVLLADQWQQRVEPAAAQEQPTPESSCARGAVEAAAGGKYAARGRPPQVAAWARDGRR